MSHVPGGAGKGWDTQAVFSEMRIVLLFEVGLLHQASPRGAGKVFSPDDTRGPTTVTRLRITAGSLEAAPSATDSVPRPLQSGGAGDSAQGLLHSDAWAQPPLLSSPAPAASGASSQSTTRGSPRQILPHHGREQVVSKDI